MKITLFNKCILCVIIILTVQHLSGQNIAINDENMDPHPSAILDISSSEKGILIPRMTQAMRESISEPSNGLMVYQTDGKEGLYRATTIGWENLTTSVSSNIPVGGMVDWLPQGQDIPEGFMICDGSTVTDSESPYFNAVLPDLDQKFIKSVPLNQLDITGGSMEHDHLINLAVQTTSNASATHSHTAGGLSVITDYRTHSHPSSKSASKSISEHIHNHEWARITSNENWRSYQSNGGGIEMVNWTNGMGADGSGNFPIAIKAVGGLDETRRYYTSIKSHAHLNTVNPTLNLSEENGHDHDLSATEIASNNPEEQHTHDIPLGGKTTSKSTNIPLYIKLVKIMRIK